VRDGRPGLGERAGAGGTAAALTSSSSAGSSAELDRYIGYWKPYATNHEELDKDQDVQEEVRNAARTLAEAVRQKQNGHKAADAGLADPRQK